MRLFIINWVKFYWSKTTIKSSDTEFTHKLHLVEFDILDSKIRNQFSYQERIIGQHNNEQETHREKQKFSFNEKHLLDINFTDIEINLFSKSVRYCLAPKFASKSKETLAGDTEVNFKERSSDNIKINTATLILSLKYILKVTLKIEMSIIFQ